MSTHIWHRHAACPADPLVALRFLGLSVYLTVHPSSLLRMRSLSLPWSLFIVSVRGLGRPGNESVAWQLACMPGSS